MNKRRSSNRVRTLLDARVIFNNRFSLIECTVRNLSETGARIAFSHPTEIPPEFELEIPSRKISVKAKAVWSDGKEHGVAFIEGSQGTALGASLPQRIADQGQAESGISKSSVEDILNEARHRIAEAMGIPSETVKLKLEITS
ncbi:PilZ domain-containing protein [Microvirga makkahensis]|uniref:PilZ domain-containing protein n=1 Tax=Microvirga makkahensis TaxID=1128670 RepID=A0A7X3MP76_9HYPH|nr:PilZ domain-containing protein [Microvirga makkahensis]MXQ10677.1 hypothetical protein [Microvirga makkahensis]